MSRRDMLKTLSTVTVATTSTAIVGNNPSRVCIWLTNTGSTVVDVAGAVAVAGAATAVANKGIRLPVGGAPVAVREYTGPLAGIATTSASSVAVFEV